MKLLAEKISQETRDAWDNFLKKHKSGHLFQSFAWGEFKKTQGWLAHRVLLKEEGGNIKAALSILEKKIPLSRYKIWYLPRGPVLDFEDKDLAEETLDFLINLGQKHKAGAMKISPDVILDKDSQFLSSLLKNKGFRETRAYQLHKCTIRLNLQRDLSDIFNGFKKNTRWEIKRAQRDKLEIKKAATENDLKIFYQLYSEALKKDKIDFLPFDYFKNLWQMFKDDVLILLAFYQERPLSAVFVACFNQQCWYLFGGSTKKEATRYSSQLLQWEAMQWAKERGCHTYDLQGIGCGAAKNRHEQGNLLFKSGFGGQKIELIGEFDYLFHPLLYKFLNILYPIYKKLRKQEYKMCS